MGSSWKRDEVGPFAGNGHRALRDGPRYSASFAQPSDIAVALGHLVIVDAEASAVRAIAPDVEAGADPMTVFSIVGRAVDVFGHADGVGASVRLQRPSGFGCPWRTRADRGYAKSVH